MILEYKRQGDFVGMGMARKFDSVKAASAAIFKKTWDRADHEKRVG